MIVHTILYLCLPCEQSPSVFLDKSGIGCRSFLFRLFFLFFQVFHFFFPDLSRKDRSDPASRVTFAPQLFVPHKIQWLLYQCRSPIVSFGRSRKILKCSQSVFNFFALDTQHLHKPRVSRTIFEAKARHYSQLKNKRLISRRIRLI